jgi:hypothetical protein
MDTRIVQLEAEWLKWNIDVKDNGINETNGRARSAAVNEIINVVNVALGL